MIEMDKKLIKEFFIVGLVLIVLFVTFIAVNYYSNQEKNVGYMTTYGYELNNDGDWVKK